MEDEEDQDEAGEGGGEREGDADDAQSTPKSAAGRIKDRMEAGGTDAETDLRVATATAGMGMG